MFFLFENRIMDLAKKYLIKFLENNKVPSPLSNFVAKVQGCHEVSYKHLHPYVLQWNITPKCNLRCKHCYYAGKSEIYEGKHEVSTQRKLELVDEINDLNIFHLIISGGEALVSDGIFEILEKIKSKNISIYMHSNGIIIDEVIANKLAKLFVPEMDTIQISLDGLEDTHEKTRGKGTFRKAMNAISLLKKYNIPVSVNCTITAENINELTQIYNLVSDLGVYKFSVEKIVPCNEEHNTLVASFDDLLKVSCDLIDIENKNTFLELATFKLEDFISRGLATDYLTNYSKKQNSYFREIELSCHRHSQLFITFEGEVFPCRDAYICQELSLGNIKSESLVDIWNNRFNNILYKPRHAKELMSENCPFLGVCRGGCPLKTYVIDKTINTTCKKCMSHRSGQK